MSPGSGPKVKQYRLEGRECLPDMCKKTWTETKNIKRFTKAVHKVISEMFRHGDLFIYEDDGPSLSNTLALTIIDDNNKYRVPIQITFRSEHPREEESDFVKKVALEVGQSASYVRRNLKQLGIVTIYDNKHKMRTYAFAQEHWNTQSLRLGTNGSQARRVVADLVECATFADLPAEMQEIFHDLVGHLFTGERAPHLRPLTEARPADFEHLGGSPQASPSMTATAAAGSAIQSSSPPPPPPPLQEQAQAQVEVNEEQDEGIVGECQGVVSECEASEMSHSEYEEDAVEDKLEDRLCHAHERKRKIAPEQAGLVDNAPGESRPKAPKLACNSGGEDGSCSMDAGLPFEYFDDSEQSTWAGTGDDVSSRASSPDGRESCDDGDLLIHPAVAAPADPFAPTAKPPIEPLSPGQLLGSLGLERFVDLGRST